MLRSLKSLERFRLKATNGDVGSVVNFLIDDDRWVLRYLVVESGSFLQFGRRVLISPISLRRIEWAMRDFSAELTIEKVKASPPIDVDAPVARLDEQEISRYYGLPPYWGYATAWGSSRIRCASPTQKARSR